MLLHLNMTSPSKLLAAALVLLVSATAQAITLDEALLADMIPDEGSAQCADPGTTSTTFTFPGTNSNSAWWSNFQPYESGLFLAEMHHEDTVHGGRRTWTIRIGEGGNIYSHYAPNLFGEAIPPQAHSQAPWIDEVLQSVSVDRARNFKAAYGNKAYYIHQAGAYQRDGSYTSTPFYSPNVARHCSGNTCTFASWGQQAHVPTPFTSPILYIHRYRNCGDGVVEYTQTIHNFADPLKTSAAEAVNDYFNTAWGGVRVSSLPHPLEPGLDRSLSYADPSLVDHAKACRWGSSGETGNIKQLKQLGGYTTFAGPGLQVGNRPAPTINIPCRKPFANGGDCVTNQDTCMVDSCTDTQVANGYTRLIFKVPSGGVSCSRHDMYNGKVCLQCSIIEQGFGKNYNGMWPCDSDGIIFKNPATNETLKVLHIRHWSWAYNNHKAYFSVDYPDTSAGLQAARTEVAAKFPPGSTIEVLPYTVDSTPDPSYDPHSIPAYTYVMGQGSEYLSGGRIGTGGQGRRRLGNGGRDYYVWTVNHINSLYAGDTYVTRQFLVASELGNVTNIANPLVDETFMDKVYQNEYVGRRIEVYTNEGGEPGVFGVAAADVVGGTTTSCGQGTVTCVGRSAPTPGYQPFFYQICASNAYAGPYPYWFSSGFDQLTYGFSSTVRSYHCAGQGASVRPTWKLLGFFPSGSAGCSALSSSMAYDETFCERTSVPTTESPTTTTRAPTTSAPTCGQYSDGLVGETGQVIIPTTIDSDPNSVVTVTLRRTYLDPVVVAMVNTENGSEVVSHRIRNVGPSSFEVFMQEPDNQGHSAETVSYLIMERGRHTLDGGIVAEAGDITTSSVRFSPNPHNGDTVAFKEPFSSTPIVLHSLQTYNNMDFMSTMVTSVTTTGMVVAQEALQTGKQTGATIETIGWIAFSGPVAGSNNGNNFILESGIGNLGYGISYLGAGFVSPPDFVASVMITCTTCADGAFARGSQHSATQSIVNTEEDQVGDSELDHSDEAFGWIGFPQNSDITLAECSDTYVPTKAPSASPSVLFSSNPTSPTSNSPSTTPSSSPSIRGTNSPSVQASPTPSSAPTQCNQPTDCVSESGCCFGSCHGDMTCHFVCGCEGPSETCVENVCVTSSPSSGPSSSPSVTGSSSPSVTGSNPPSVVDSQSPSVEKSEQPTVEESSPPSVTSSSTPSVTTSQSPSVQRSSSPSVTGSSSPSVTGSSTPSVSASASPSSSPTSSEGLGTCSNSGAVCSKTADCDCPFVRRLKRDLQVCQGPGDRCGGKNGACCSGSQCINFGGGRKECSAAPTVSPPTSSSPTAAPTSAPVFSPPTSDAPTPGPLCECVFPSESPSALPSATVTGTPTKLPTTSTPTRFPTTSSPTIVQTCIIRGDLCSGPGDTNCCNSDSCVFKGKSYKCSK